MNYKVEFHKSMLDDSQKEVHKLKYDKEQLNKKIISLQ